ncbi:MAG: cytochrome c oxidase subunit [Solirubrobacterales bacterium]|nr:cytochrome c oxidase subunit [Solirubrobacterales bacterium]
MNRIPAALRRTSLLLTICAATLLGSLALAGPASAGLFGPESGGSPNADRIADLYWIIFAIALVVFVLVEGALIYSLFKFRARKGAVAAQIRGNTRLEIGWTVGAAVILVALAIVTFVKLPGIRTPENSGANGIQLADGTLLAASPTKALPPNGKSLNICVNGQQYIWRYTYSDDCTKNDFKAPFAYTTMVVPTDTTVTLDITAQDVIHSWWIPKLGGKMDATPGYYTHTWFKIPASMAGQTFRGQCAELCGRNHADMLAFVNAVSPADFEKWLDQHAADIKAADDAAAVQRKKIEGAASTVDQSSDTSTTP